jgi:hypothetical protein
MQPWNRWRFLTDGVMGGLSTGRLDVVEEEGMPHVRMTGRVSTANRGGFIQMRTALDTPLPAHAAGLRLIARGNGERYFVHLRTTGTLLPWQFYQAGFDVPASWTEIRLSLGDFRAAGGFLRLPPLAESITSVAVAAYGRDHAALIEVRDLDFY